jgi:predicted Zn-dependent protease
MVEETNYNSISKAILDTINRWKDVSQKIIIGDNTIEIKPSYISTLYRDKDIMTTELDNGAIRLKNQLNTETGCYNLCNIGDKIRGCGQAHDAAEDLARHPKTLAKHIDNSMDEVLKTALSGYLGYIAEDPLDSDNTKTYKKFGKEKISKYDDQNITLKKFTNKEINLVQNLEKNILKNNKVTGINATLSKFIERMIFIDSEGREIFSNIAKEAIHVSLYFEHDDHFQREYNHTILLTKNRKNLSKKLNSLETKILKHVEEESSAKFLPSGQYPVIFGHSAAGTLFHEALGGHLLSGEYIVNGQSTIFKDKIGQTVLPEFLTIIDNPLDKTGFGYYLFDDQGIAAKKVVLVDKGVLKNYLLDRNSAAHLNTLSNGHSKAEWVCEYGEEGYESINPEPRVSNLEIHSTKGVSEQELERKLINECKKTGQKFGIYVESSAGEVDVTTSQLTITPNAIWKIYTNGKKERVTGGIIVGNPYELLQQISATSNNYKIKIGYCGASSHWIRTQERAPSIFLPKVTFTSITEDKKTKRLLERIKS